MTFLNPALLWGLLALSVPIIIHFFNLQRPREILFSNVAFVREVKKTVVRRVKFQQWLLLLLRLLAVAFLVFAFAKPVILKENQKINSGGKSVVFVVDNSLSMKAGNERGNYFQQAISLARSMVKAYDKQSEFLIMEGSNLRLNYDFGTLEEALEELNNLKINQNDLSLKELMSVQNDLFSKAGFSNSELIFMSDFQESTIFQEALEKLPTDSNLSIKFIPLATRQQKNIYIKNHSIRSRIIEKGKPVSMSLELTNDSDENISNVNVRVMLEGKAAAINNADVEKQGKKELDISFTPNQSGWLTGEIRIDDNPIDFDNTRYFSLYIPEEEKVLILEDQSSYNLKLLYENLFESFQSTISPLRNAATVQFSDYKSIVLVGLRDMTSGLRDKLISFLNEGGSVLLIPGDDLNLENVNSFLTAASIGQLEPSISIKSGQKANQAELDHPVFEGIFSEPQSSQEFDAPSIFKYYPLKVNNSVIQNRILQLEGQQPILMESELEGGLMYTFTIFPGDDWTDLHVKSIFAPLMFRITQIMNQTGNSQSGQTIGDYAPKSIRTSNTQSLITLVDKDGKTFTPEQYIQGGATTLNFSRIGLLEGNYSLEQDGQLLEKISFNISDQESQLAFFPENDLKKKLSESNLQSIDVLSPKADLISKLIQEEEEGVPLWKYFVLAALLFLVLEILVLKLRFN